MPLSGRLRYAPFCAIVGLATLAHLRAAGPAQETTGQRLVVRVATLRNDRGNILISVFRGPTGFPDKSEKAVAWRAVPISKNATTASIAFEGLAPGDYAVSLFHDENANGKLDEHWGIPTEGFGISNNPRIHWGAPTYKESRFVLTPDVTETTISVSLRYLRGGKK